MKNKNKTKKFKPSYIVTVHFILDKYYRPLPLSKNSFMPVMPFDATLRIRYEPFEAANGLKMA